MSEEPFTIKQLIEIQEAFANIPEAERANATSTETSGPLSVRKEKNNPAQYGVFLPIESPQEPKPVYPKASKPYKKSNTIAPNTIALGQPPPFKPSKGEN